MKLAFVDTETTSLRPDRRAWEVAVILREAGPDFQRQDAYAWDIDSTDLDLANADERSLAVGRFYERHPNFATRPTSHPVTERSMLVEVERLTRGAVIVGAVPWFDTEVLGNRMRAHGLLPSWHYALVDVKALAAGAFKLPPPWSLDDCLAGAGLVYAEAERHTALGDARMVRDLYDAVMAGAR